MLGSVTPGFVCFFKFKAHTLKSPDVTSFPGDSRETVRVKESTEGADVSEETPKISLGNILGKLSTEYAIFTYTQAIFINRWCTPVGSTLLKVSEKCVAL